MPPKLKSTPSISSADTQVRPVTSDVLASLPNQLAAGLLARSTARNIKAGEMLFLAGDPGDGLYRIDEGLLKVSIGAAGGAERILAILGQGAIVGDLSVIDGLPRSASVTALRDCKLRFISRSDFDSFAQTNPDLYKYLLKVLAARLRDTDTILAAGSFLPLKGRVARALLDLAKAFGKDVGKGRILIHQKISQADVAAIAGVARENVSRILKEWMNENAISRLAGYYCLESKSKIERQAEL
jgi:CRP/FNR family transcriptional regulator, cyclic AMP receptor protein